MVVCKRTGILPLYPSKRGGQSWPDRHLDLRSSFGCLVLAESASASMLAFSCLYQCLSGCQNVRQYIHPRLSCIDMSGWLSIIRTPEIKGTCFLSLVPDQNVTLRIPWSGGICLRCFYKELCWDQARSGNLEAHGESDPWQHLIRVGDPPKPVIPPETDRFRWFSCTQPFLFDGGHPLSCAQLLFGGGVTYNSRALSNMCVCVQKPAIRWWIGWLVVA